MPTYNIFGPETQKQLLEEVIQDEREEIALQCNKDAETVVGVEQGHMDIDGEVRNEQKHDGGSGVRGEINESEKEDEEMAEKGLGEEKEDGGKQSKCEQEGKDGLEEIDERRGENVEVCWEDFNTQFVTEMITSADKVEKLVLGEQSEVDHSPGGESATKVQLQEPRQGNGDNGNKEKTKVQARTQREKRLRPHVHQL
ncbi:unnamed protein product [Cuscuta epithymum]|uniref:Uncharacterized protein n=1 Tax=Cuscuta epithymum TaxID=186058 RepID=A0AAV0FN50_9ASTE|nr:unnamed protein product [Cuscuta epithymum]